MDLRAVYSSLPGVTGLAGMTDAWYWSTAPGLDSTAALSGEHAFQAFALDSYDEGLAVAMLSFCRERGAELLADRPLVVADGFSHPGYGFDLVVAMSPEVHGYYRDDPETQAAVRAVVPAFRCEFAGDEDLRDANYRHNRAAGVQGTRWNRREPRPYVKVRYLGDNGRLAPRRGFAGLNLMSSWYTTHEGRPDLFVEFENYRHEVYTITWTDTWTLTGPDAVPTRFPQRTDLAATVNSIIGL